MLSNTRITCPWVRDNPGKLGLIPDRSKKLECSLVKNSGAQGWVCGLSGSSGCNVPTSLRRVRVVRARALRWILRHESRPYGVQQARKLYTAGNRDKGTPSAAPSAGCPAVQITVVSKGRARPVPAAAVTPAARVVAVIIGFKGSVAGLLSLLGNLATHRQASKRYW